ncbi:MAG: sugar ABC transporter permease [Clostridiales bacterium]|nr:sugar ABC transporter permease [Clostridiales bacterium]
MSKMGNSRKELKNPNYRYSWRSVFSHHFLRNWQIYVMLIVPVVYYIVFRYVPMFGNIIAFRKYRAGGNLFGSGKLTLRYFQQFTKDKSFWRAFRNTLTLNITYLLFRFPLTLIFALLINEIRNLHWKKFVQTVSYLPHFISMVIVCGMIKELVSTGGPINSLIVALGGQPIQFLAVAKYFVGIFTISGVWQSIGWGTILYLAAMSNINPSLYEAAAVDGAGHFQRVWHITLPSILPTITTLLILDIGGLVGSGGAFEKVFLLYNPMIYSSADIVSTYVYRMGIGSGNYSYATAVGLFEGLINLVLLTIANVTSKKLTQSSLF